MIRTTLLFSLLVVAACAKTPAELEGLDRQRLETVLAEDGRVSARMGSVDKAVQQGDLPAAIGLLDGAVRSGLADERRALDGVAPGSAWGQTQRAELAGLVADRQAAVGPYREALLGKGPEAQLAVLENEAKIERRALAVVAALRPAR